ncbi:PEGA domain-containing protein, partial [Acidobacteria bacterium ACD]|nr:PEGA domain-containing protein [Acidobacteria bacterium ACD]
RHRSRRGRAPGHAPRGLVVEPGKHTVTVVRPGFQGKTFEVESKPGVTQQVVVELEK